MTQKAKTDLFTMLVPALLAAVLALTYLVYLPGLSGPLLFDDLPQLDGLIAQSADDPAVVFRNHIVSTSGPTGRPVTMATFIADAVAHGPDIRGWKYSNLMYHLISGLLVCWLTAMLLKALPGKVNVDPWMTAVVIAGLWLLHPLHVSTVLYTVQRMTELSTLFVLAGLVCYVKGRMMHERSSLSGWLLIALGFGLFYPLGVFSKENAVIYPVYCSLIELLIFQFRGPTQVKQQVKVFHGLLLAGYIAGVVLVLANFSSVVLDSYAARDFTLLERILTQFRVLVMYLSQIMLPIQRNMGFFHDDVSVSISLINPVTTLMAALALLALLASSVLLWRKRPLFAFGVLFFFASHVVESSVIGLELMYEHRNYIGSFGILLAALDVVLLLKGHRRALSAAATISLIAFSFLTLQRSITWSTPESMYSYMYTAHPESPRLNLVVANINASAGDFPNARRSLAKSGSGFGVDLHSLYFDCLEHGQVNETAMSGIASLRGSVVDGHATSSAELLVNAVVDGRCKASKPLLAEALDHMLASRARTPTDMMSVMFTKAKLLESMGDIDSAVDHYLAAQDLSEGDALSLYLAADMLIRSGRTAEGRNMLTRAYEMEKNTRIQREEIALPIYAGLGMAYEEAGQYDEALMLYAEAVASMPSRSLFYVKTAELLLRLKRYDQLQDTIDDIRRRNLADLGQHDYSLRRIETMLAGLDP